MPRHPNQDTALREHYGKRRDETREAFLAAMDRLLRGEPLYTDGRLVEANLFREAKRSRATLNRYPDIKTAFSEAKKNRNRTAPTNLAEKARELEETVRALRREENQTIRTLKESRDRLAHEVYILSRLVERLKEDKSRLESQLDEALRGARPRVLQPEENPDV